jgi:glycosyltransferase involved in cell wall biosynthesis
VKTSKSSTERIKLGIIADEFFDLELGRRGGFGWAARQVALLFNREPELNVEVVFLSRTVRTNNGAPSEVRVHDTRLLTRTEGRLADVRRLRAERFDLLLMIDYRPSYRFFAAALPRTPIIIWVRDPRTPEDVRKLDTLRIPGAAGVRPQGIEAPDCTSLGRIVGGSRVLGRPVLFATPAPELVAKVPATYGVAPREVFLLPNPVDLDPGGAIRKCARPRVLFLGRLDPIKRPWLFTELAEQFPEVEFVFLGQSHFEGEGAWRPDGLPPNVRTPGHMDGARKLEMLSSAWLLVNTSIHEALAVSFLEALACETPIVSCQNVEGVASRFGEYVGRSDGDGLDALPRFAEALRRLLRDEAMRTRLGRAGRAWVSETHNTARFLSAFGALCAKVGVDVDLKAMSDRGALSARG